jgi:NAD-dependent deacetylase
MSNPFEDAAQMLRKSQAAVAVTGAGASEESGIPTFRGAEGLWAKYPPAEYATIDAYLENPAKIWGFWRELVAEFSHCKPNPGHVALANLEKQGILKAVVTQNIDGLHQAAGSRMVIEYHGNAGAVRCLDCNAAKPIDPSNMDRLPPRCPVCRGLMKPDVVLFGEMIPGQALIRAEAFVRTCDTLIVVGTSAQVFPAAALPLTAKQNGAHIIECNRERTDFTATVTDAFLEGPAGETLPRLMEELSA